MGEKKELVSLLREQFMSKECAAKMYSFVHWSVGLEHIKLSLPTIFSRVLRDSTSRFVGPSVRPSIVPSHFIFVLFLRSLASLLLPT